MVYLAYKLHGWEFIPTKLIEINFDSAVLLRCPMSVEGQGGVLEQKVRLRTHLKIQNHVGKPKSHILHLEIK